MRLLGTVLLAVLTAPLLGGCATTRPPSNTEDICAIFTEKPSWRRATLRAERNWGVPVHVQMAIMHQESRFQQRARPPRKRFFGIPLWRPSSAFGYAQVKDETWDWYRERTGRTLARRTSFSHATDFIGWYTNISERTLDIPKHDARNQYLAYHEGHGGYKRKSYNSKRWLVDVAGKVQRQSDNYRRQLISCRRGRLR